jgi:glycosyltransferase involved in cell wall biosynthesis
VRIALVDPAAYTLPYDHHLAAALARRGHDPDLVTSPFPHGTPPQEEGYRRHEVFFPLSGRLLRGRPRSPLRFIAKGLEYLPSMWRLARKLDEIDPEVVHVQWLPLPRYDRLWLRRAARRRPVVFTAHDVLPRRSEGQVRHWRELFLVADRTVVHSERARERLAEIGVPAARIAVIPHPLFLPRNGAEPTSPGGRTLLFFGLIRPNKGLDVLLRALPAVADAVPDVRLVVAGDPVEPVTEAASERVDWRLRYIGEDEVHGLMEEATVVVLPYRKIESSGVLATALGHGRPVVVTDVGSLGDTVREFQAGEVVPPEDPDALGAACAHLLTDESALAQAFEGTRRAAQTLTWDAAAQAHEHLYEGVLRGREGS